MNEGGRHLKRKRHNPRSLFLSRGLESSWAPSKTFLELTYDLFKKVAGREVTDSRAEGLEEA